MGRYYNTNTGHEGKFGFAVQASDDPKIFGMEELRPSCIDYQLEGDEENIKHVKEVISKQYDILGVNKEDRIFELDSDKIEAVLEKYRDKNYHEYDEEKDDGIPYSFSDGSIMLPNNRDIPLAECRIQLGLTILDDLEKQGYCFLTAEY